MSINNLMPFRTFRLRTESNSLAHVMRLTRPPQKEVWGVGDCCYGGGLGLCVEAG